MISLRGFPKPIIIQINNSAFLEHAICCAVEECVAYLIVIVPDVIGDAIKILSQPVDRRRP